MWTAHRQLQGLGTIAGPQHEIAQWLFGAPDRQRLFEDVHLACELPVRSHLAPRGELPCPRDVFGSVILATVLRVAVEQQQELGPGVPRVEGGKEGPDREAEQEGAA